MKNNFISIYWNLKWKIVMLQKPKSFHSDNDNLGYINIFPLTIVDSLEQLNIMKFYFWFLFFFFWGIDTQKEDYSRSEQRFVWFSMQFLTVSIFH